MTARLPRATVGPDGVLRTRLCCADFLGDLAELTRAVACYARARHALGAGPLPAIDRPSWARDEVRFYRVTPAGAGECQVGVYRLGRVWTAAPGRGPSMHRPTARGALEARVGAAAAGAAPVPLAMALLFPEAAPGPTADRDAPPRGAREGG